MDSIENVLAEDGLEYLYDLKEEQGYQTYLKARKFLYDKYKIPDLICDPYVRV